VRIGIGWVVLLLLSGCGDRTPQTAAPAPATPAAARAAPTRVVDADELVAAAEPANWLSHGRNYAEQRYSPLDRINAGNVAQLALAWYFDLDSHRGIEATPIVVDGVLYTTDSWSTVYALDAATGELQWKFDPKVSRERGFHACCDVGNRGVARAGDKVYVAALDGRLIALDAATGARVWEAQTVDPEKPYTSTGAPRVVKGKVIIGNAGAEFGVRGYVSAFDAETGALAWRFHTVPGNPALGFESPAMERAAKTWNGEWWKEGGGGTVWDAMAYDPELDLLYVGTDNGTPWNQRYRSPGGGDNLFLASIVALKPDTGEYVWHYQVNPGETWDYSATQHMILADIDWQGAPRKVLMQAPKNGFFYVIDRATGELLGADPYVTVTWATHVDRKTGRPIETPTARYQGGGAVVAPSPFGGHNWQPMSYSPRTGLVYIPTQDLPFSYAEVPDYTPRPGGYTIGVSFAKAALPPEHEKAKEIVRSLRGAITAWDPINRRTAWKVDHPALWNGGLLATAGDLVFQGTNGGEFSAYRADTGDKLWSADAQTGIHAGAVSYAVRGEQYVAVMAGSGTVFGVGAGQMASFSEAPNRSRVLAYKLGGGAVLPATAAPAAAIPAPPPLSADADTIARGKAEYDHYCARCHGDHAVSGGVLPDLRHSSAQTHAAWASIVGDGALAANGMIGFGRWIPPQDVEAIHQYVIERAHARAK
jgi:PQQ-dependent dehydrogenase (methanol/ethanol family)